MTLLIPDKSSLVCRRERFSPPHTWFICCLRSTKVFIHVGCIITLSGSEYLTFTALHKCMCVRVCALSVWGWIHLRALVSRDAVVYWGARAPAFAASPQSADTQQGVSLRWELTGSKVNGRCEIRWEDGVGNESTVASAKPCCHC